jgi:hypothetical protein
MPFPFLNLPGELRNKIYRLLLCNKKTLGTAPGYSDFRYKWSGADPGPHCAILRVNRQLYQEGRSILYGENTFGLRVLQHCGDPRAYFMNRSRFVAKEDPVLGHVFKNFKSFEIVVEIGASYQFPRVNQAVRSVSRQLAENPELKSLNVYLEGRVQWRYPDRLHTLSNVLESLSLLRNVGCVNFYGVDPEYGQNLKSTMEGNTPLDHLPNMYDALVSYVGQRNCCRTELEEAKEALERFDVAAFKLIRAEIVVKLKWRDGVLFRYLYNHDAGMEGGKGDREAVHFRELGSLHPRRPLWGRWDLTRAKAQRLMVQLAARREREAEILPNNPTTAQPE